MQIALSKSLKVGVESQSTRIALVECKVRRENTQAKQLIINSLVQKYNYQRASSKNGDLPNI